MANVLWLHWILGPRRDAPRSDGVLHTTVAPPDGHLLDVRSRSHGNLVVRVDR